MSENEEDLFYVEGTLKVIKRNYKHNRDCDELVCNV